MKSLASELAEHESHIEFVLRHVPCASVLLSADGPSPLFRIVYARPDGAVVVISEQPTWKAAGKPTVDAAWEDAAKRVSAFYGKTRRKVFDKPTILFNRARTRQNWRRQSGLDEPGL